MIQRLSILIAVIFSGAVIAHANPTLVPGYLTLLPVPGSTGCPQGITNSKSNPSTIYWCRDGIWKSTNGGETWNRCGTINSCVHVRVDPANVNHVYAVCGVGGSSQGFWRSTDGGSTWEMPQGFITTAGDPTVNCRDMYEVSPDPSDFNHALVSFHSPWANSTTCGVLETTDGGTSWRIVNTANGTGGPGYGIFFLYAPQLDIGDKNTWLMGCQGAGYWRTSNAGASWTKVLNANMVHGGDQLYYSRNGALYTGADAGAPYQSMDNGITWVGAESRVASSYYLSVTGDGYFLYTASFNTNGPIYITPESDGLNWKTYKQPDGTDATLPMGTFEMAFDSGNHIMYFSSPYPSTTGMWAMKLLTPAISFSHQSITPASVVSDVDRDVIISIDVAGSISQVYADLGLCGGTNRDALIHGTGNTWQLSHTVPAHMYEGLRNVVLTAISTTNDTATISMRLEILDNISPLLVSQGKTAASSSTQQGNVAANAFDGSMTTRWESTGSDPQWLSVDLGASTLINRVVINWESAFASSYQIQISDNGTDWTDVYSTTSGNGGTDEIWIAPVTTRYVRMLGTKRGTNYAYSIYEFAVYSYTVDVTRSIKQENAIINNLSALPHLKAIPEGLQIAAGQNEPWELSLFSGSGRLIASRSGIGSKTVPFGQLKGFFITRLATSARMMVGTLVR